MSEGFYRISCGVQSFLISEEEACKMQHLEFMIRETDVTEFDFTHIEAVDEESLSSLFHCLLKRTRRIDHLKLLQTTRLLIAVDYLGYIDILPMMYRAVACHLCKIKNKRLVTKFFDMVCTPMAMTVILLFCELSDAKRFLRRHGVPLELVDFKKRLLKIHPDEDVEWSCRLAVEFGLLSALRLCVKSMIHVPWIIVQDIYYKTNEECLLDVAYSANYFFYQLIYWPSTPSMEKTLVKIKVSFE